MTDNIKHTLRSLNCMQQCNRRYRFHTSRNSVLLCVFTETLRKYPVLPFLDGMCCIDYKLPSPAGNGTITLPSRYRGLYPVINSAPRPDVLPRTAEVRSRPFHRRKQTQSAEIHIYSIWRGPANVHR